MGRYSSYLASSEDYRRFRILFNIPTDVRVGLVGSLGGDPVSDPVLFSLVSIVESGVTFPLSLLVLRLLGFLGVSPIVVAPDVFKIASVVEIVNRETGLGLGLRELCYYYRFFRAGSGLYSLEPRGPERILAAILSESLVDEDVVVVSGRWEFERGPRDTSPFLRLRRLSQV